MASIAPDPGVTDPGAAERASPIAGTRRENGAALLLAFACAVLFLRAALLPGNALVPHPPELFDVVGAEAVAAGSFDPDDAFRGNVGMTDKYLQSLCWDRVMQDRLRSGELPRWTRDIGGGAPFVEQMAQPYQPINLLLFALPSEQWYGWWYLVHLVLFGWFAYRFVRRLGCAHAAGLLALVAATLGMWTQCKLHHNVILTAALSLWPMLSATHALVSGGALGRARSFAVGWLALWTGLSWSTGFVPVALQVSYLTCAFALFCALRRPRGERLRPLLPVAVGLALGGAVSLANMLPILLASTEAARAGSFDAARLAALSLEWDHLLTTAWPDLLSWPADRFYQLGDGPAYETRMPWSQLVLIERPLRPEDASALHSWVETSFAIGLVPLGACATALVARRHRALAWFFAAMALFAFGVASATEPLFTVGRVLPGLATGDLRRLLFSVAMPLVALTGIGADAWLRGRGKALLWPARATWALTALASLLVLTWLWQNGDEPAFVRAYAELYAADRDHETLAPLLAGVQQAPDPDAALVDLVAATAQQAAKPGEVAHNQAMLAATAWRALLVCALALLCSSGLRRRLRWLLPTGAVALTIGELLHAGLGPVQTVPAARVTTPPKVLGPVFAAHEADAPRPRLQRLVPDGKASSGLPGNVPGFLGLEDANSYNPLSKARQEQFFECVEAGVSYTGAGVGSFHAAASLGHPLCDLFGVRFVVAAENLANAALRLDGVVDRTPGGTGGFRLLERTTTLPRATFVRAVDVLPDEEQRLAALADPSRDVGNRVVLEDPRAPRPAPAGGPSGVAEVLRHDDERVVVGSRSAFDGYVRLADPWDAGWTATVDGAASEVYVADHYLRAVYVPAGEHRVEFTYDGARVVWPLRLTLLAYAAVAFLLVTGRRRRT